MSSKHSCIILFGQSTCAKTTSALSSYHKPLAQTPQTFVLLPQVCYPFWISPYPHSTSVLPFLDKPLVLTLQVDCLLSTTICAITTSGLSSYHKPLALTPQPFVLLAQEHCPDTSNTLSSLHNHCRHSTSVLTFLVRQLS